MIEATQRKLREAEFFYGALLEEHRAHVAQNPDAFAFYLSAFLAAGRSVTYALQCEEHGKHAPWYVGWRDLRPAEDREFLHFMKGQRDKEVHQLGAETTLSWEMVPMVEMLRPSGDRRHMAYSLYYFTGPPGTPQPEFSRRAYHFAGELEVMATCERYLRILQTLIRDFLAAHAS